MADQSNAEADSVAEVVRWPKLRGAAREIEPGRWLCLSCHLLKPRGDFYIQRGIHPCNRCKSCTTSYQRKWDKSQKGWLSHRRASLKYYRRQRGLPDTFDIERRLSLIQEGRCAICDEQLRPGKATALDHDHRTGRIRALLCSPCNLTLGKMRDDPDLLEKAAAYLRFFKAGGSLL